MVGFFLKEFVDKMNGLLVLSDGTIFRGVGFGAETEAAGEVVFNTSIVGYEEALTDPSYNGQILTMTYPVVGIYGIRKSGFESDKIQPEGFVVRENSVFYQHKLAVKSLDSFLKEYGVPGISGIDTRSLTRKIRVHGVMNGVIVTSHDIIDKEQIIKKARNLGDISDFDLIKEVSVKEPRMFFCNGKKTIAIIDFGTKKSIIRFFNKKGVNVILLPYNTKYDELENYKINGVLLGNGPGDPKRAKEGIELAKNIAGKYPLFGICLGHQIISLAMGANTYKMKFGHRGSNQPVKNLEENRVYITSQNHGFAVDESSIGSGMKIDMINLNDNTVEGMHNSYLNINTVQFHPEASPGPWDFTHIFEKWVKMM